MIVDLRSDVLTRPTPAMFEAMVKASMGDDVFEEDENCQALEAKVAEMTGMEAALFVVSGTMANQLAIASQTLPRDEIILDVNSHIFQFEQGAPALIGGVQTRSMNYLDGLPDENELAGAVRFPDVHHPRSQLICFEISHNYNGGAVVDYDQFVSLAKLAGKLGLKVHLDGARIWNAVIASGRPVTDFTKYCDTMMFCFSKGLGAPIGSILVGPKEVIKKARYVRKGLGGGWRQPGMLAQAALHTINNHIERLAEDHEHAKLIAETIGSHPELKLTRRVDTNMIFFSPKSADLEKYSKRLMKTGLLFDWEHFRTIRLVTYLGITREMVDYTIEQIKNTPVQ